MNRKIFNHKILQELKKRRHVQQLPSFKLLQFSKKLPESVERWKSLGPKQILSESKSSNSSLTNSLTSFDLTSSTPEKSNSNLLHPNVLSFLALGLTPWWEHHANGISIAQPHFLKASAKNEGRQTVKSLPCRFAAVERHNWHKFTQRSSPHCFCPQRSSQSSTTRLDSANQVWKGQGETCWKDVENIWKELKGCESMQGESRDPKIWGADTLESKTKDSQVGKHMKKLLCIDNCVT